MKVTGYRVLRSYHDWGRPIGDVNDFIDFGITEVPIVIVETDGGSRASPAVRTRAWIGSFPPSSAKIRAPSRPCAIGCSPGSSSGPRRVDVRRHRDS